MYRGRGYLPKRTSTQSGACFFFVTDCIGQGLNLPLTARERPPLEASRANNLQTSENTSVKCFREGLTAQSAVEQAESCALREETPMRLPRMVVGSNPSALSKNIVAPSGKAQLHPRCSLFLNFAQKTVRRTVFYRSPRNQKRFHSRYNFGYGILLYIRKMPIFRPLTALFGGSRGVFSYKIDKSALACPA